MSITRTSADRQYEHIGNVRHGVQTGPWRVEFDAPVFDDVTSATHKQIFQGTVVSLNSSGAYVLGCGAGTTTNKPVPCISMKNVFDPDVTTGIVGGPVTVVASGSSGGSAVSSTYSTTDINTTVLSAVGGKMTAIPCTAGYELETTEFDTSATYAPNDGLTVDSMGKIKKATVKPGSTEPYLGFVSVPAGVDYLNNKRLAFFSDFIPAGIVTE